MEMKTFEELSAYALDDYLMCPCGKVLQGHEALLAHWQMGHWGEPKAPSFTLDEASAILQVLLEVEPEGHTDLCAAFKSARDKLLTFIDRMRIFHMMDVDS